MLKRIVPLLALAACTTVAAASVALSSRAISGGARVYVRYHVAPPVDSVTVTATSGSVVLRHSQPPSAVLDSFDFTAVAGDTVPFTVTVTPWHSGVAGRSATATSGIRLPPPPAVIDSIFAVPVAFTVTAQASGQPLTNSQRQLCYFARIRRGQVHGGQWVRIVWNPDPPSCQRIQDSLHALGRV